MCNFAVGIKIIDGGVDLQYHPQGVPARAEAAALPVQVSPQHSTHWLHLLPQHHLPARSLQPFRRVRARPPGAHAVRRPRHPRLPQARPQALPGALPQEADGHHGQQLAAAAPQLQLRLQPPEGSSAPRAREAGARAAFGQGLRGQQRGGDHPVEREAGRGAHALGGEEGLRAGAAVPVEDQGEHPRGVPHDPGAARAGAGEQALSREEVEELRAGLKQRWNEINQQYQLMTHVRLIDTTGLRRRKQDYERQLAEIEADIRKLNKAYIFVE